MSTQDTQIANENWEYFEYTYTRGHREYCRQANKCERFYLGGGEQWDEDDKATLISQGRLPTEANEIMTAVNTVAGYQINNRMDVTFLPRGGEADEASAETMTKVTKQILDNCQYKWMETDIFMDGMIQQRGYMDMRVDFNDSMLGEVALDLLDPLDVMPDPDAKSYNPDDWGFVIITRWLTLDAIEGRYGAEARRKVEEAGESNEDFGEDTHDERRSRFAHDKLSSTDAYLTVNGIKRARIIDRQFFVYEMTEVMVSPDGDIRVISRTKPPEKEDRGDDYSGSEEEGYGEQLPERNEADEAITNKENELVERLQSEGWILTRKMQRRVKWVVSTAHTVLFDGYSPTSHYSVIPYFAYFRRGQTRGLVDNAISLQEVLNKAIAQYIHIINTTANSGWVIEQNSLTNMTVEELEASGAKTGLIIEYKEGAKEPKKIEPNKVPDGLDRFIIVAQTALRTAMMVSDSLRADTPSEASGVAIQSRQFIAQQQLAIPLDNLARTRYIMAERLLEIVQKFYTEERIVRITGKDITGKQTSTPMVINQIQEDGSILNNLTMGEYDIVIVDQPMQVTWENSQFNQGLEMRKAGINIPDATLVLHSNLTDKGDILKQMTESSKNTDPLTDAEVELKRAQAGKIAAETINKGVESMYSATTAANLVAGLPSIAPLADAMLKSAGFQDMDAAPIVSAPEEPVEPMQIDENTHPLSPPNPDVGMTSTPHMGEDT